MGEAVTRRTREECKRLGRSPACDYSAVKELADSEHHLHNTHPRTVLNEFDFGVSERALRRQLKRQDLPITRRMCMTSCLISAANQADRIAYGREHSGKAIRSFWRRVYFTDEAQFNSFALWNGEGAGGKPTIAMQRNRPMSHFHVTAGISYKGKGFFYLLPFKPTNLTSRKIARPRKPR